MQNSSTNSSTDDADADCRDLAQTTAEQVTASVAADQAALAGMPNGTQCNEEGDDLVSKSTTTKTTADSEKATAEENLEEEKTKLYNIGSYSNRSSTARSNSSWRARAQLAL